MLTFAPMLDVSRDPRWGRISESAGEDTWLTARLAEAKVRGFQRPDLTAADSVATTAKHLAAYGASAGRARLRPGRRSPNAPSTRPICRPLKAAIDAGCPALMPAFTDLEGVPMTANAAVLQDPVRGRWGFDGIYISDYNAIAELVPHGVAADILAAAALALKAGMDIDMMASAYTERPAGRSSAAPITMADLDAAVRRVLAFKARLGLFDDPYRENAPSLTADQRGRASRSRPRGRAPPDGAAEQPQRHAADHPGSAPHRRARAARRQRHARCWGRGRAPAAARRWSASSTACARPGRRARSNTPAASISTART